MVRMGPVIVLALGLAAGALLSRPERSFIPWTLLAAAVDLPHGPGREHHGRALAASRRG